MLNLSLLIAQILVVLVAARLFGLLFRRIHQPQVIGEMVAGIILGPSLFGWLAPGVSAALFPPASLGFINALSQIGLVVFMFLVGLELDLTVLRGAGRTALLTSHASIVAPFVLGSALALYLYPRLADDHVSFTGFALFMGVATSITAFPVLARIIVDRKLTGTRVGTVATSCAAVDDVTAWCILAAVIVIVQSGNQGNPLWLTLGGSAAYVALAFFGLRPLLRRLETLRTRRGALTQDILAATVLLALASGWMTESLGIHALFGGFLMGAIMPKDGKLVHEIEAKLHDLTVVLLLPLFFAYTGLRTSFGLLSGGELWTIGALVIAVAILGKFGGSFIAARLTGMSSREASAIGALMNTRGLIELVALNIGLDIGVISPTLFAMLVLMALLTTFMTSPLLALVYPERLFRQEQLKRARARGRPDFQKVGSVAS